MCELHLASALSGSLGCGPGPCWVPWSFPVHPAELLRGFDHHYTKGFLNAFLRTLFPSAESSGSNSSLAERGWSRSYPVGKHNPLAKPRFPWKIKPAVCVGEDKAATSRTLLFLPWCHTASPSTHKPLALLPNVVSAFRPIPLPPRITQGPLFQHL